jgi:Ca2+-binding RTX toxin-like protein
MTRGGAFTVAAACAALLAAAPAAAFAAQGSDTAGLRDYVTYTADPGETNQVTVDGAQPTLHIHDSGAVIRWVPDGTVPQCTAVVHDVFCNDQNDDDEPFELDANLGDGNDSFTNLSDTPAYVELGPGNDTAVGGSGYVLDGGPGADDLHGGPRNPAPDAFVGQAVTYQNATGPVTVSADNSDVVEIDGSSSFANKITGFSRVFTGNGDDTVTGTSGDDTILAGRGNDTVTGGAGRDMLYDLEGDNVVHARDGQADDIWCSSGHDTVFADPQDVIHPPPSVNDGGPCDDLRIG